VHYRPEIDGLRALAVLPVIFFHADLFFFSGGFVGVDIFFVISGYLITSILIKDLRENKFSISKFYERRARRILPALFFVIILSIPIAWITFLPKDLLNFFQSVLAITFFSSNILFWRESGYFDSESSLKPLLHTWSLSVEEQFYVLFPIFLFIIWRYRKNNLFLIIFIAAVLSLLLSEWGQRNHQSANFFLAPTRAWELLVGVLASIYLSNHKLKPNNILASIGILMISFSIIAFDKTTPFPSLLTLIPVLGTLILILYTDSKSTIGKVLGHPSLVAIGLISYSAYLFHQPILVFFNYKYQALMDPVIKIFLIAFTLFFAFLSWKFIEQPFRDKERINTNVLLKSIIGTTILLTSLGLIGITNFNGSLSAFRGDPFPNEIERTLVRSFNQFKNVNGRNLLIWGDSYADALIKPLNDGLSEKNVGIVSFIKHSCPSLLGTRRTENRLGQAFSDSCYKFNQETKLKIEESKNDYEYIIFHSAYYSYEFIKNPDGSSVITSKSDDHELSHTINGLINSVTWAESIGLKPIIILPIPLFIEWRPILRRDIEEAKLYKKNIEDLLYFNRRILSSLSSSSAIFIDPTNVLCGEGNFCGPYNSVSNKFNFWYDGTHISYFGGSQISDLVIEQLNL